MQQLIFRKIKFHAVCIESETSRPSKFLKKCLYNKEILYRNNKSKILSVYKVLENLINHKTECKDFVSLDFEKFGFFEFPKNSTFFHYNLSLEKIKQSIADEGYDTDDIKATQEAYNDLHYCCKYKR